MSPLSRSRVLISLEPAAVHAVQLAGAVRRRATARHFAAVEPHGGKPWEAAANALQANLGAWKLQGAATVVLSSAFVRYAVVPHAENLSEEAERHALARAHFERIHGERAQGWQVRIAGCVGIAVDAELVESLRASVSGAGLRLASIQPYLMSAFNRARGRVPERGAWIALAEAERVCVALLDGTRWVGVSVLRESLPRLAVEREQARMAATRELAVLELPLSPDPYAMALSAE